MWAETLCSCQSYGLHGSVLPYHALSSLLPLLLFIGSLYPPPGTSRCINFAQDLPPGSCSPPTPCILRLVSLPTPSPPSPKVPRSLWGVWVLSQPLLELLPEVSMGLRSGDCAGHGRTSIPLFLNHSLAFLQVCLGSLSCWMLATILEWTWLFTTDERTRGN